MTDISYACSDGLNLAYQVVGDGPVDLVLVTEWATPLEARWDVPAIAGRLNRLASFARLISFDKRGIGLSDRVGVDGISTPELWVRDLVAVLDAAGSQRPVVFGAHEGGQIAALFAASVPDRTEALVLVNTGARLTRTEGYDIGFLPEEWHPDLEGILRIWEEGGDGEVHIAATATDPYWRTWYARSRRQQVSPAAGVALMEMFGQLDVRHALGSIVAPTLVVHRVDNRWWDIAHARYLAAHIPEARLVELPGADNYWWAGDADAIVDEVELFLLGERRSRPSRRVLATLLFTDIVGSTAHLSRIGDERWAGLLDAHNALTRREVERFGGRVVKDLGDGVLATLDGPARAIEAALAIREAVAELGLAIRAGVHTGEVEPRGEDLGGIGVHIAARVVQEAAPGEIVVTSVVKGLVAGSPIRFESKGYFELRDIPERWELFAVVDPTSSGGLAQPAGAGR